MRRFPQVAAFASLAATLALALSTTVVAAHDGSPITGHVYVNDNTAGVNRVSGLDRHSDGSLTRIPGSPFRTGGAGSGAPVATQGALQFSADHRYVLAVDPGSNQVSVLWIEPNGALKAVDTEWSHGTTPGSIGVDGTLVYVVNTGTGGKNYTGFRLHANGQLDHIAGSTIALPDVAYPGEILFSSDGRHAAGIRTGGTPTAPLLGPSSIDSFVVQANGHLDAAPGSPFASQQVGPIGAAFRPGHPRQLFVTNAHGGPGMGSVSAYHVAGNGELAPIAGSPTANGQTATCWIDISRDGKYLYVVNTGTPSLSSYSIAQDGSLTLLGSVPFKAAKGPFDVRLDPTDSYLYVVDPAAKAIHAFSVIHGSLSELPGSPFPVSGDAPEGIITD
jgi:6-phosphogluconolactonase